MPRNPFRSPHGTPIEEAPWWLLVIFTGLLWLVACPAIVGLLHGLRLWHGERVRPALAAAVLAVVVVVGLATRKPWRRTAAPSLIDERPLFVRFSTWLFCSLLYPNLLLGAILLLREGPPPDYTATLVLGLLLSTLQTILARLDQRRESRH